MGTLDTGPELFLVSRILDTVFGGGVFVETFCCNTSVPQVTTDFEVLLM